MGDTSFLGRIRRLLLLLYYEGFRESRLETVDHVENFFFFARRCINLLRSNFTS